MEDADVTPVPVFDAETGYLRLKAGNCTQIVARFGRDGHLYVWWRRGRDGKEIPLTLDLIQECYKTMTG